LLKALLWASLMVLMLVPGIALGADGLPQMTENLQRLGCKAIPLNARPVTVAFSLYPKAIRDRVVFAGLAEIEPLIRLCGEQLTGSTCTAETIDLFITIGSQAPGGETMTQSFGRFEALCVAASVLGKVVLDTNLPRDFCIVAAVVRAVYQAGDCALRADRLDELATKVDWPMVLRTGFEPLDAIRQAVVAGRLDPSQGNILRTELIGRQGLVWPR